MALVPQRRLLNVFGFAAVCLSKQPSKRRVKGVHVAATVAYLEAANEVVSGEQLVEYEFEGVIPAGLVQGEHIKRPLVNILRAERGRSEFE